MIGAERLTQGVAEDSLRSDAIDDATRAAEIIK
jgi:hypothetical protein